FLDIRKSGCTHSRGTQNRGNEIGDDQVGRGGGTGKIEGRESPNCRRTESGAKGLQANGEFWRKHRCQTTRNLTSASRTGCGEEHGRSARGDVGRKREGYIEIDERVVGRRCGAGAASEHHRGNDEDRMKSEDRHSAPLYVGARSQARVVPDSISAETKGLNCFARESGVSVFDVGGPRSRR